VGKFSDDVLKRIAQQQSLPSESAIPIPDAQRQEIVEMMKLPLDLMFQALAASTRKIGDDAGRRLGQGAVALQRVLSHEAGLLDEVARTAGGSPTTAVRGLLVQRFYATGTLLIKQVAVVLGSQPQDKHLALNAQVIGMFLSTEAGFVA
jgi:hypothetical protein